MYKSLTKANTHANHPQRKKAAFQQGKLMEGFPGTYNILKGHF